MSKRNKVEVGQTLVARTTGWPNRDKDYDIVTVSKVGRKYFTAGIDGKPYTNHQYRIDDWSQKTEYTADYKLYLSVEEYENSVESVRLYDYLQDEYFNRRRNTNLNLKQLRAIKAIIESE